MWLLKFNEHQEFYHYKTSLSMNPLMQYVADLYSGDITFEKIGGKPVILQVLVDGEEIGFIGQVDLL